MRARRAGETGVNPPRAMLDSSENSPNDRPNGARQLQRAGVGLAGIPIDDSISDTNEAARQEGNNIVEHWDVVQEIPETTASGQDLFSELTPADEQRA